MRRRIGLEEGLELVADAYVARAGPNLTGARRGQLTAYPNIRSFQRTFRDKVVSAIARVKALHRLFRKREVELPGTRGA